MENRAHEMGILEEDDVKYVIAWINDLNKIGHEFPKLWLWSPCNEFEYDCLIFM